MYPKVETLAEGIIRKNEVPLGWLSKSGTGLY